MSTTASDEAGGLSNEEKMTMRLNVINEIIVTERDFVRDLATIMEEIMKPVEDKMGPYVKLFTPSDISTLFCNIAMIEVMCKDLLRLFEQAASEAPRPADAAVGKAFLAKKIALTASFSAYCANQSKALQLFESLKKKTAFTAYLQTVRENPNLRGLGLLDWLIKPVQRVTKYPLLLRELEKYTPANHSDYENTVLAAKAVQELVDQVNIAAKTMESFRNLSRIADDVSDIPNSLQLKSNHSRYYVTEGRFIKVSHGKHQERMFWLFSDLLMYGRPNVANSKKYTYKGTIIISKSDYEDLPDGNEYGANAIRITRLDSKKTYIIYCKDSVQKAFWLTNINELKTINSKGPITHSIPTIGVATIVSDSNETGSKVTTNSTASANMIAATATSDTGKSNNSLIMWSVAVRIAGWTNDDQSRTLLHECAVKCKPFGKDTDYCFVFSDGWMGTKIRMFKTAQSSKNAVDFKVFVPFELMLSVTPKTASSVEIAYKDPIGGKDGAFTLEFENAMAQGEFLRSIPKSEIGLIRDSDYTKRISHQSESENSGIGGVGESSSPVAIVRSQTISNLSFSSPSLPHYSKSPGPPIPAVSKRPLDTTTTGTSTYGGASSPNSGFSNGSSYNGSSYNGSSYNSSYGSTSPSTSPPSGLSAPLLSSSAPMPNNFAQTMSNRQSPLPESGNRSASPKTVSPKVTTVVSPTPKTNGFGDRALPQPSSSPTSAGTVGSKSISVKTVGISPAIPAISSPTNSPVGTPKMTAAKTGPPPTPVVPSSSTSNLGSPQANSGRNSPYTPADSPGPSTPGGRSTSTSKPSNTPPPQPSSTFSTPSASPSSGALKTPAVRNGTPPPTPKTFSPTPSSTTSTGPKKPGALPPSAKTPFSASNAKVNGKSPSSLPAKSVHSLVSSSSSSPSSGSPKVASSPFSAALGKTDASAPKVNSIAKVTGNSGSSGSFSSASAPPMPNVPKHSSMSPTQSKPASSPKAIGSGSFAVAPKKWGQ